MTLRRVDEPHRCPEPPKILTYEPGRGSLGDPDFKFPRIVDRIPVGSTWTCDECERTLVVWNRPMAVGATTVVMGGPEWREETRWERWKRHWRERRGPVDRRPMAPPIPMTKGRKPTA